MFSTAFCDIKANVGYNRVIIIQQYLDWRISCGSLSINLLPGEAMGFVYMTSMMQNSKLGSQTFPLAGSCHGNRLVGWSSLIEGLFFTDLFSMTRDWKITYMYQLISANPRVLHSSGTLPGSSY